MKKTILLSGALTALLTLTGCTPASPSLPPATHPAVAAKPSSRATPTVTPAPVPVVQTPSAAPAPGEAPSANPLVMTFDGLGPYMLGEDPTDALLGSGFTAGTPGCVTLYSWSSGDPRETKKQEFHITVALQSGHEMYAFASEDSWDGTVVNDPRAPKTNIGLTIGDTMDKVIGLYPGLSKTTDYGGYREYTAGPVGGHYILITTTGSLKPVETVTGLRAAVYPGGSNIPGC